MRTSAIQLCILHSIYKLNLLDFTWNFYSACKNKVLHKRMWSTTLQKSSQRVGLKGVKMKKVLLVALVAMMATMVFAGGNADNDTISVITREDGSGTRGAFVELVGLDEGGSDNTSLDAIVHDGTGKVMTAVQNDKNAIGYISLGSLNDTVKAVSIDGVSPSVANIQSGSYKIARPFNIAYGDTLSSLALDFIDFIKSEEGQAIASEEGFIPVYDNAPFSGSVQSGTLSIGGSTSVYPLMEKLAEAYKQRNPNVTINIEGIGSSAGVKGAIDGTFEIGMASRTLKDSELAEINGMVIAQDGIAVVVNKENTLSNLSVETVKEIYLGNVTNYSEVE